MEVALSDEDEKNITWVPLSELKMEDGADELMKSLRPNCIFVHRALMQENTFRPSVRGTQTAPSGKEVCLARCLALKWHSWISKKYQRNSRPPDALI